LLTLQTENKRKLNVSNKPDIKRVKLISRKVDSRGVT